MPFTRRGTLGTILPYGGVSLRAGPLSEKLRIVKDAKETYVLGTSPKPEDEVLRTAADVVKEHVTKYTEVMLAQTDLNQETLQTLATDADLWSLRLSTPPTLQMPDQPPQADTALKPAIQAIFANQHLLSSEDPAVFRGEDLDAVKQAETDSDNYDEILRILEPLVWSATARKREAQWVLYEFATRVAKRGSAAIGRHRVLTRSMGPLLNLTAGPAAAGQETRHVKAQVAHEVEAETLERVKTALKGQPAATTPATSTPAATTPAATTPATTPSPVLPQPKHKAPARGAAPKTRGKPK